MTNVDLIALDMDGTLLDSNGVISPENHAAVQKAKEAGIKVVLCTGRPLPGVKPYLEQLNLISEGDYVITYNGALIQHSHNGTIVAHHTLDRQDFMVVSEWAEKAGLHFHGVNDSGIYTPNKNISYYSVRESFITTVPLRYRSRKEIPSDMTFSKLMMVDPPEIMEKGLEKLPKDISDRYTVLRSELFFLEFMHKQASKGQSLKHLADNLGSSRERVLAIGDNENDVDMIAYAGIGIAMDNAVDAAKEVSNHTTLSHDENGVAQAILEFAF